MKDVFSAFQQDVFRPIVTLLIPSAIWLAPWLVGLLWQYPSLDRLISGNHTETAFILVLVMLGIGLICEDAGARLENLLDDRAEDKQSGHYEIWFKYLRTAFVADPIGRKYLRTLVVRLKFELGCFIAVPFSFLGVLWLWWIAMPFARALTLELLLLAAGIYFWSGLCRTHQVLANTREELMQGITVVSASKFTPPSFVALE